MHISNTLYVSAFLNSIFTIVLPATFLAINFFLWDYYIIVFSLEMLQLNLIHFILHILNLFKFTLNAS